MADIVNSKNNIPIRLTEERWFHIIENHDDLAGYYEDVLKAVEEPDYIVEGYRDAVMTLRYVSKDKFLAVVYKEFKEDGFIVTAYFSRKIRLDKEVILWQRQ